MNIIANRIYNSYLIYVYIICLSSCANAQEDDCKRKVEKIIAEKRQLIKKTLDILDSIMPISTQEVNQIIESSSNKSNPYDNEKYRNYKKKSERQYYELFEYWFEDPKTISFFMDFGNKHTIYSVRKRLTESDKQRLGECLTLPPQREYFENSWRFISSKIIPEKDDKDFDYIVIQYEKEHNNIDALILSITIRIKKCQKSPSSPSMSN